MNNLEETHDRHGCYKLLNCFRNSPQGQQIEVPQDQKYQEETQAEDFSAS